MYEPHGWPERHTNLPLHVDKLFGPACCLSLKSGQLPAKVWSAVGKPNQRHFRVISQGKSNLKIVVESSGLEEMFLNNFFFLLSSESDCMFSKPIGKVAFLVCECAELSCSKIRKSILLLSQGNKKLDMPSEISNETSCIELIYSFKPSGQWLKSR